MTPIPNVNYVLLHFAVENIVNHPSQLGTMGIDFNQLTELKRTLQLASQGQSLVFEQNPNQVALALELFQKSDFTKYPDAAKTLDALELLVHQSRRPEPSRRFQSSAEALKQAAQVLNSASSDSPDSRKFPIGDVLFVLFQKQLREIPVHAQDIEELVSFLTGISEEDFEGAKKRILEQHSELAEIEFSEELPEDFFPQWIKSQEVAFGNELSFSPAKIDLQEGLYPRWAMKLADDSEALIVTSDTKASDYLKRFEVYLISQRKREKVEITEPVAQSPGGKMVVIKTSVGNFFIPDNRKQPKLNNIPARQVYADAKVKAEEWGFRWEEAPEDVVFTLDLAVPSDEVIEQLLYHYQYLKVTGAGTEKFISALEAYLTAMFGEAPSTDKIKLLLQRDDDFQLRQMGMAIGADPEELRTLLIRVLRLRDSHPAFETGDIQE